MRSRRSDISTTIALLLLAAGVLAAPGCSKKRHLAPRVDPERYADANALGALPEPGGVLVSIAGARLGEERIYLDLLVEGRTGAVTQFRRYARKAMYRLAPLTWTEPDDATTVDVVDADGVHVPVKSTRRRPFVRFKLIKPAVPGETVVDSDHGRVRLVQTMVLRTRETVAPGRYRVRLPDPYDDLDRHWDRRYEVDTSWHEVDLDWAEPPRDEW